MSGTPTEAELIDMLQASVDILETTRDHWDTTLAGSGGKYDTLIALLEGEIVPDALAGEVARHRAGGSALLDSGTVRGFLDPLIFEWMGILRADATLGFGSGYTDISQAFEALYEWFAAGTGSPQTVESRAITYAAAVAGGSNVGNGGMERLTVDSYGYNLEACFVEKKTFRCRVDQNSGADENAEVFEFVGMQSSVDSVNIGGLDGSSNPLYGSGTQERVEITSLNAGTGQGGSILSNSSFSTFNDSATPKFSGWDATGTGTLAQDTTTFYRTHPNAQTDASMKMTVVSSNTLTVKQAVASMRVQSLAQNTPYFFRVMVNGSAGSAAGGSVHIRLGSQGATGSSTSTIAALSAGWNELFVAADANCYYRNFNEDPMDVEIEWAGGTGGYVLFDDAILVPWTLIDGTYWVLRGNAATHTPWLVDDTLTFTDTGGAPATGKIQYHLWRGGYGYLPSSGSPTIADP